MFSSVAPEIWFDDVDEIFIERATPIDDGNSSADKVNPLVRPNSFEGYVLFTLVAIVDDVFMLLIKLKGWLAVSFLLFIIESYIKHVLDIQNQLRIIFYYVFYMYVCVSTYYSIQFVLIAFVKQL